MKKIKILNIIIAFMLLFSFCFNSVSIFADGDTNIGNGGDDGGYEDGSGKSDTILGNEQDEGVRVTLVDAETYKPATSSIDFANNPRQPIQKYLGTGYKLYYKENQKINMYDGKGYKWKTPKVPLPKIVGGDLQTIKNYFGSEAFSLDFSQITGFDHKKMTSGDYKLMLEPIGYPKIKGKVTACTPTELALLDIKSNGYISNSWIKNFTHMNLPLAMFLEKNEFGLNAYKGGTNYRSTNETIINQLGVGAVIFKEKEDKPEIEEFDYLYRTDTDVITSVKVSGGESNPDQPVKVYFDILGEKYEISNIFYPNGESQLAWVKWHTPKEPMELEIPVTIVKEHLDPPPSVCNPSNDPPRPKPTITETTITVKIEKIEEKTPPDPDADDRWGGYQKFNVYEAERNIPKLEEVPEHKWGIWSASWHSNPVRKGCDRYCDSGYTHKDSEDRNCYHYCSHGKAESHYYTVYYTVDEGWWDYEYNEKYARLKIDHLIKSDKYNPTAKKNGKEIKSAYGVDQFLNSKILSNDLQNTTNIQNGVSLFPDFYYKNYFRLLDLTYNKNNESKLEFKPNRYSTLKSRTHFTPIWYPDKTNYNVYTYAFDAWTPVGMLSINLLDGVYIDGDMWDDWTVRPLPID